MAPYSLDLRTSVFSDCGTLVLPTENRSTCWRKALKLEIGSPHWTISTLAPIQDDVKSERLQRFAADLESAVTAGTRAERIRLL
jgi:hypothetical protein